MLLILRIVYSLLLCCMLLCKFYQLFNSQTFFAPNIWSFITKHACMYFFSHSISADGFKGKLYLISCRYEEIINSLNLMCWLSAALKCLTMHVLGRSYLAKNSELIVALITCFKTETEDMLTQDHTLGCLQRLSLKSQFFLLLSIICWAPVFMYSL